MMATVDHIAAQTYHGRRDGTKNAFRYSLDYVLLDAEAALKTPLLFSRNGRNLMSLWDTDHGGAPGQGSGPVWVRQVLSDRELDLPGPLLLLAQPRILGHVFNPVSFWLCHDAGGTLRAVIAEVTNTFGDRHSYLCHHDDLRPLDWDETVSARKIFHVSPFQDVTGDYAFRFRIDDDRIDIRIDYLAGNGGLVATLTGERVPVSTLSILRSLLRRPFGSRRVLALIHWQALKLWWKGVAYRTRPEPPHQDVSQ